MRVTVGNMTPVLGILGGTFDPIHYGHLELAREVGSALRVAAVRLIPAGDPPHRAAPVATAAQRLAMVELALAEYPDLEIDAREIRRAGPSYTVVTLEELRAEAPLRPLALIVGADAFLGLPTWHRWRELFGFAHVIIAARPGVSIEAALPPVLAAEWSQRLRSDAAGLAATPAGAFFVQSTTPHAISASAIRRDLARGPAGLAAVRGLLPATVLAYIERNQLYRPRPDAP